MNKYSKSFSEDMTSEQAMFQYFSLLKEAAKEGDKAKEELTDAYKPIRSKITRREIDESFEKGII